MVEPVIHKTDLRERLYLVLNTNPGEMGSVIRNATEMRDGYCKHYPDLARYIEDYKSNHAPFVRSTKPPYSALSSQETDHIVDVGVAAGFYYLTPPVALYLMSHSVSAFINSSARYAQNPDVCWQAIGAQTGFLVIVCSAIGLEIGFKDPERYIRRLVRMLPIPRRLRKNIRSDTLHYAGCMEDDKSVIQSWH